MYDFMRELNLDNQEYMRIIHEEVQPLKTHSIEDLTDLLILE